MKIESYENLIVWQKSINLVIEIYKFTEGFPTAERYGLTSQMRRVAISIPSNIAEGKLRGYMKECKQFFLISFGSGGELETQIEIVKRLYKKRSLNFTKIDILLMEVMKMLNKLISGLEPKA